MELPALFATVPVALVPSQIVAEFSANTFLESIVVAADNTLFITSHYEGKVIRVTNGTPVTHAVVSGKATGLAAVSGGDLLLSGWDQQEQSVVWQITPQGEVTLLAALPDALFLNGLARLTGDLYLIADSYRGAIWLVDAGQGLEQGRVQLWLEHALLARGNAENPVPAVNGLKIFQGVLYASNTQNTQLIRVPLGADHQPGEPEVFVSNVNLDDFAFDQAGNLYGATHFYNSLVKIAPDRSVTTIAQLEQGMAGSTAVAFGRGERCSQLYVTTNGGMSLPPATGVETAKLVELEVGVAGLPL